MRTKKRSTKKDIVVILACLLFLLANLAAIGAGGRRRAKEALCLSNLRQWGVVWKMFTDDNQGRSLPGLYWFQHLEPYCDNARLRLCPAAAKGGTVPPAGGWAGVMGGKFTAWGRNYYGEMIYGSYGLNQWATTAGAGSRPKESLWATALVEQTGEVPVLLDCAVDGGTPWQYDRPPDYDGQVYYGGTDLDEIRSFCIDRHNGGVNGLFLDFSARKVGLKQLWQLRWHRKWTAPTIPVWPGWMENFKD